MHLFHSCIGPKRGRSSEWPAGLVGVVTNELFHLPLSWGCSPTIIGRPCFLHCMSTEIRCAVNGLDSLRASWGFFCCVRPADVPLRFHLECPGNTKCSNILSECPSRQSHRSRMMKFSAGLRKLRPGIDYPSLIIYGALNYYNQNFLHLSRYRTCISGPRPRFLPFYIWVHFKGTCNPPHVFSFHKHQCPSPDC